MVFPSEEQKVDSSCGSAGTTLDLRKLLLHIKSLVWCLNKAQQQYNVTLMTASLENGSVIDALRDTNLGDNLAYLLSTLPPGRDIQTLIGCLRQVPASAPAHHIGEMHYEVGHYLQTLENVNNVPKGSYGIISFLGDQTKGLFYVEKKGLVETLITWPSVKVIYGTRIY
jgi:hypothetical protein